MLKKLISFTPRMVEMVEEIKTTKGHVSFSSVIHQAVQDLHAKTFPNYIRPLARDEKPEEKVRRKAEEKQAKAELVREEQLAIAEQLGGQIIKEGGKEFVLYHTYSSRKRFEQKVPLNMVSTDMVKTQYQPSRERVEQLQAEGKVEYPVK